MILVLTVQSIAAEISFHALPVRNVNVGDKFALTFRLNNGQASAPKPPQLKGCTFIFGPATSSRQSYQVVNGHATSSSSIDYTYTYRADKTGKVTVGSVSVNVDGKKYTSRPLSFTIGEGSPRGANGSGHSRSQGVQYDDIDTQDADKAVNANDVFVRIILSKPTAFEQEAIECTIKLYTKYQISQFFPTKQPSFDGFLIQEMELQPSLNEVESYNGQNYMTAVLKKCIIFPQRSGNLNINSGNYDIYVVQYEKVNMGIMTVSNPRERKIKVSSNSASINITPLPQPQPDGFTGAVGCFSVNSHLVGNAFRTGEAGSLVYTITGTGNIKYLKEPDIDFPSEFELYSPKNDIKADVAGNNVTGTMTIDYTFVPKSVGQFTIGSNKFIYFDPAKREYVTLTTPRYEIKVAQGTAGNADRQDISVKNTDIHHIHSEGSSSNQVHTLIITELWFWMLYLAALAIMATFVWINRRNARLAADVIGTRVAKSGKVARRRLKKAGKYMQAHDSDKFHAELLKAMWGYLGDKLSIPVSQLNRDNIAQELDNYGAGDEIKDKVIAVLDDCEMARYTPVQSDQSIAKLYDLASETIHAMENMKHSKQRKS